MKLREGRSRGLDRFAVAFFLSCQRVTVCFLSCAGIPTELRGPDAFERGCRTHKKNMNVAGAQRQGVDALSTLTRMLGEDVQRRKSRRQLTTAADEELPVSASFGGSTLAEEATSSPPQGICASTMWRPQGATHGNVPPRTALPTTPLTSLDTVSTTTPPSRPPLVPSQAHAQDATSQLKLLLRLDAESGGTGSAGGAAVYLTEPGSGGGLRSTQQPSEGGGDRWRRGCARRRMRCERFITLGTAAKFKCHAAHWNWTG